MNTTYLRKSSLSGCMASMWNSTKPTDFPLTGGGGGGGRCLAKCCPSKFVSCARWYQVVKNLSNTSCDAHHNMGLRKRVPMQPQEIHKPGGKCACMRLTTPHACVAHIAYIPSSLPPARTNERRWFWAGLIQATESPGSGRRQLLLATWPGHEVFHGSVERFV